MTEQSALADRCRTDALGQRDDGPGASGRSRSLGHCRLLRAEPTVFGPVAFNPTVSCLISRLAGGGD
ncbi:MULTISPECIES: hypothetical protein [Streptomyces]|uniref:Uncharacterized protein n=1 Tax=Streptomyces spirodelae TaxID=2812904 RepID=A0ABS3X3F6_9ACTN|nr:hypothetical protein [Streptomyces spirodelae]MBO8189636.1 hypothetical protein [Streptomyces spirodelae]